MKIVYFSESLPPIRDGVSNTLSHLAETLLRSEVRFRFYSPVDADRSLAWFRNIRLIRSIPVALHHTYRMGYPYFQDLNRQLDLYRPDIVHVVSPSLLGNFAVRYARSRNIPVVSSYHTHFTAYFPYYGFSTIEQLGWKYLQWFYNRCTATLTPSPSAAYELRSKGIRNVGLWQRGIDTDSFSAAFRSEDLRRSAGVTDSTPILLYVGRLVKEKDLYDLITAVGLLEQWGSSFKTVIVGDGPLRGELVKRLPRAHFTGYLHGRELARWYASSDIFIFPSTTETFGNVILEASASGIPSVGVEKGGVADIISHGINGLLARPKDPLDFALKIKLLLDDPGMARQLGHHAEIESAHYDWNSINMKLIDCYRRLTDRTGRGGTVRPDSGFREFSRQPRLKTAV
jgi:phosphatidylinositol alpha 1,6-mannosyltransferase